MLKRCDLLNAIWVGGFSWNPGPPTQTFTSAQISQPFWWSCLSCYDNYYKLEPSRISWRPGMAKHSLSIYRLVMIPLRPCRVWLTIRLPTGKKCMIFWRLLLQLPVVNDSSVCPDAKAWSEWAVITAWTIICQKFLIGQCHSVYFWWAF